MTVIALTIAALLSPTEPELRTIDFCTLPGNRCGEMSKLPYQEQEELHALWWCCPYVGAEGCSWVDDSTWCDPEAEYAVYCEWGRTVPQSSETGTVECYW
jgi:hypothetical protein